MSRPWFVIAATAMIVPARARADDARVREVIAAIEQEQPAVLRKHRALHVRHLWFDTEECKVFAGRRKALTHPEVPKLVECLHDLGFRASAKTGAFVNATYGPGIAVNVTVQGSTIVLQGYDVTQHHPGAVGIEPASFASHVAGFSRELAPDDGARKAIDASADAVASAVVHVCVDAKGAITLAKVQQGAKAPRAYADRVTAAIRGWKVSAFAANDVGVPACTRLVVGYPANRLVEPLALPEPAPAVSRDQELRRIAGDPKIQPNAGALQLMQIEKRAEVIASYKLCIDEIGTVVRLVQQRGTGYESYDTQLEESMAKWRYEPVEVNNRAVPACTTVTFVFTVPPRDGKSPVTPP